MLVLNNLLNKKVTLLIVLILAILVAGLGFFWWQKSKETYKIVPAPTIRESPAPGVTVEQILKFSTEQDPPEGNSGKIKLELDLTKSPPELSWPEDLVLQEIKIYSLGSNENAIDNMLLWEAKSLVTSPNYYFTDEEKKNVVFGIIPVPQPLKLGETAFPLIIVKPYIFLEFQNVQTQPRPEGAKLRYSIEADFKKDGDEKIYKGIYGFSY